MSLRPTFAGIFFLRKYFVSKSGLSSDASLTAKLHDVV